MYRALIISNSRFPEDPGELPELHGPKVDGTVLRDALCHHETGMFQENEVSIYPDAGCSEILEAIDDFFGRAAADDVMLFYYSGHGWSRNQQLFLCARNTVVQRIHSTAISQAALSGILINSLSRTKILIFDCCYSGLFKGRDIIDGMSGEGRYVFAASPATDKVTDSRHPGMASPFTAEFTEALICGAQDRNGDGIVDLDDVAAYLNSRKIHGFHPRRSFDGSGAIPIARRPTAISASTAADLASAADARIYSAISALDGQVRPQYLDRLAPDVPFSQEKTSDFRRRLRPDIASEIPPQLNASEFLQRAGLLRNGQLSYAGVLLFGSSDPSIIMPSALVQCVRFYGNSRGARLEAIEIHDTVPETIVRAWDFVADACRLGEIPTSQSPYAEPMYKYPMVAVRELIANAIVHRDYEVQDACTQILIFENRLEVISPGGWGDSSTDTTAGQVALGELRRQSRKRNFRLAQTLTWSRLVEGVGAGIPRAIEDCARMGSPEPTVVVDERMVTVTIYARAVVPDGRHKHTKVPAIESSPARLMAINSRSPLFFLSYSDAGARSRRSENQFLKFFEDLSMNVAELVSLPSGEAPGYMAITDFDDDDHWTDEILEALGACQVFVPLLSPHYFASRRCLEEWRLFTEREVIEHGDTEPENVAGSTGILPIFWAGSISYSRVPEMIGQVKAFQPTSEPDRDFGELYQSEGIAGLMRMKLDVEYQRVIWRIAQRIGTLYDSHYRAPALLRASMRHKRRDIAGSQD